LRVVESTAQAPDTFNQKKVDTNKQSNPIVDKAKILQAETQEIQADTEPLVDLPLNKDKREQATVSVVQTPELNVAKINEHEVKQLPEAPSDQQNDPRSRTPSDDQLSNDFRRDSLTEELLSIPSRASDVETDTNVDSEGGREITPNPYQESDRPDLSGKVLSLLKKADRLGKKIKDFVVRINFCIHIVSYIVLHII
jgi:hypothetical protein